MTSQLHSELASEDFRRGIAYAAHAMLHTVNAAHGQPGWIPAEAGLKRCCADEVLAFAEGIAATLNDVAGGEYEHPHDPDHHAVDGSDSYTTASDWERELLEQQAKQEKP